MSPRIASPIALLVVALASGPAARAAETVLYVPAAAHAQGLGGSFWRTELRLMNPSSVGTLTVFASFLPSGKDNRNAAELSFDLPARHGLVLSDVVSTTFAATGAGAIRLRAAGAFLLASRTLNTGGAGEGAYGVAVPAVSSSSAVTVGLLFPLSNSTERSNIGFLNPGSSPAKVHWRVTDVERGVTLGEGDSEVPPLGFVQVTDVFTTVGAGKVLVRNGALEFDSDQPLVGFATVIDTFSGDGSFFLATSDTAPGAAQANQ